MDAGTAKRSLRARHDRTTPIASVMLGPQPRALGRVVDEGSGPRPRHASLSPLGVIGTGRRNRHLTVYLIGQADAIDHPAGRPPNHHPANPNAASQIKAIKARLNQLTGFSARFVAS